MSTVGRSITKQGFYVYVSKSRCKQLRILYLIFNLACSLLEVFPLCRNGAERGSALSLQDLYTF